MRSLFNVALDQQWHWKLGKQTQISKPSSPSYSIRGICWPGKHCRAFCQEGDSAEMSHPTRSPEAVWISPWDPRHLFPKPPRVWQAEGQALNPSLGISLDGRKGPTPGYIAACRQNVMNVLVSVSSPLKDHLSFRAPSHLNLLSHRGCSREYSSMNLLHRHLSLRTIS